MYINIILNLTQPQRKTIALFMGECDTSNNELKSGTGTSILLH